MKKLIAALLIISSLSLGLAGAAQALDLTDTVCDTAEQNVGSSGSPTVCENRGTQAEARLLGPDGLVTTVVQIIVFVVGAVSVIMIIVGGFRYVVSGGDSNGIQGAKNTILYALVGLVVAVFAQVLVSFILGKVT